MRAAVALRVDGVEVLQSPDQTALIRSSAAARGVQAARFSGAVSGNARVGPRKEASRDAYSRTKTPRRTRAGRRVRNGQTTGGNFASLQRRARGCPASLCGDRRSQATRRAPCRSRTVALRRLRKTASHCGT